MQNLLIIFLTIIISAGIIVLVNFIIIKRKGEKIKLSFIISLCILLFIYSGLFLFFQHDWKKRNEREVMQLNEVHAEEIRQLKEQQAQEIETLKRTYAKELALVEWKNKVFTSESEMAKALRKAQTDYQLTPEEVRAWRNIAENNTIEKLMPKKDTKDVLKEYQARLKKSLAAIRSGQTLMNSDIRLLADNINTIRLIGKEYEKVLATFRELYGNIVASYESGTIMERPKQKKFLFFPIKQKEYDQLLEQYYQAQGNQKAVAEIAEKLKLTIDKAEQEFKAINRKFEQNLAFLETTSSGISYNAEKLENLIEAAISEADIVSETQAETTPPIKVTDTQKKKN